MEAWNPTVCKVKAIDFVLTTVEGGTGGWTELCGGLREEESLYSILLLHTTSLSLEQQVFFSLCTSFEFLFLQASTIIVYIM